MAEETPPVETDEQPPAAPPEKQEDEQLGEAGTKALEETRSELKKLKAAMAKREKADEDARLAAMDENARAVEEAKREARESTVAEYEAKILGLRVQARAANFHDPELVAGLLELPADASDAEIDKALAGIAKSKPYLTKSGAPPPMPQGPRGDGKSEDAGDWLRDMVKAKQAQ